VEGKIQHLYFISIKIFLKPALKVTLNIKLYAINLLNTFQELQMIFVTNFLKNTDPNRARSRPSFPSQKWS